MKKRAFALLLAPALLCVIAIAQNSPLKLERAIQLPGVEGRIDHLTVDVDGNRVFVAALGNGSIEVVDLARGERTGEIKGLKEPQGLYYRPDKNILYVATGGDGMVRAYNAKTLTEVGSTKLGEDADNVRYDHETSSVLVGYGSGAIASLPMNLQGKPNTEIALPAHPESFQETLNGSRWLVNLPRDQSIALVDFHTSKIISKWTNLGAQSNFPMAVARPAGPFFVACRAPAELLELQEHKPTVVARINTVGDADDLFWDEVRKRLYVIGGEGFVDVVDVQQNGAMKSIAHVQTAAGARTELLVENKLIVAAPHRGSEPARLLVFAPQ
jgi:DNA-binding beta-propeller fold protein YncE